jgi:hypothetical protein
MFLLYNKGRFNCIIIFICLKGNTEIQNGGQFEVYSRFIEANWYQSELKIRNIQKQNYGDYKCLASNDNGTDTFTIKVDPPLYDIVFTFYSIHGTRVQRYLYGCLGITATGSKY